MSHPAYKIEGPALISFSGGRTSAYMLHEILAAHDGKLPPDVHVTFANTGKEREETLRFVHDCASHWGVRVRWLEYRGDAFEEVGFNSASRQGEPFAVLIEKKQYLPNAVTRFCTVELKIRVMRDFARAIGFERWSNVIGLRYDEGLRVLKALARNDEGKERFTAVMPLSKAKVTKADVMAFWQAQPFDLGLKSYEGNCDLCFLKAKTKLEAIIREQPGTADWWISQETSAAGRFVTERSYASLAATVRDQGHFFDGWQEPDDDEHDVECGLTCEPPAVPKGGDDTAH
jgi:3'-phosphoadenosine 5'-phosphosulfate sulfotransferase (PAPS reductase)/FAD synthetase